MTNNTSKSWFVYDKESDQLFPFGDNLRLAQIDPTVDDTHEKLSLVTGRTGLPLMDYLVPVDELDCACATCRHVEEVFLAFEKTREATYQVDPKDDCDCAVCHFYKTNSDPELKVFRVGEDSPRAKHVYAAFITENGGYNPRLHGVFADEARAEQWLRQKPKVIGLDDPQEWYIERWAVNE